MGYQFRMSPQVEKWAAQLNAYLRSTWRSIPAPPGEASRMLGKIGFWIAQPGLDAAYQGHLAELRRARRAVAGVATSRKRLELQIAELERQASTAQDVNGQLHDLRRQYADVQAKEQRVVAASRRMMAEINAFQAGKEAAKAAHTAVEEAAQDVWTQETGNRGSAADTDGPPHASGP
jgi:phage shock protein A